MPAFFSVLLDVLTEQFYHQGQFAAPQCRDKRFDFVVRSGFLARELVAGKAHNCQLIELVLQVDHLHSKTPEGRGRTLREVS